MLCSKRGHGKHDCDATVMEKLLVAVPLEFPSFSVFTARRGKVVAHR